MSAAKDEAAQYKAAIDFFKLSDIGKLFPELGLASTVINVLMLAVPVMILQVYDRIIPHQSQATLGLLVVGVVIALAIETAVRLGRNYVTGWLGSAFDHRLSCEAFKRLLRSPLPAFEREGPTVLMERLRASAMVREFYSGQALLSLFDLPFVIVYVFLIFLLGGWLVMVPLVMIALFSVVAFYNGRQVRKDILRRSDFDERRFSFLAEALTGIHSVKSMSMEEMMQRRYEMLQDVNVDRSQESTKHSVLALNIAALFSQLSTVAVVGFGVVLVVEGRMTPGALAACILLAGRSLGPMQSVLGTWVRFQGFAVARQQIEKLFEMGGQEAVRPDLPVGEGGIVLENVTLAYKGAPQPILDGASLEIKPGECIAIQGDNGSGKTSVLSLIAGLLPANAGRVLVDGHDLAAYSPSSVARRIGYLPQQGVLIDGTILENITMFNPALEDSAFEVAELLGLDRVVAGMRLGYDTPVGNSASEAMPAGIKQRVAIARALVHNPDIVLFDEANIAIDSAGDELLRQYLVGLKGRKTMVLVTHRPSLVKMADRVLNLVDGKIVDKPPENAGALPGPGAGKPGAAASAGTAGTALAVIDRPQPDERMTATVLGRFPVLSDLTLCLPTLLKAMDWKGSPRQLAEALPHFAQSLDLAGLRRVLANLNYSCHTFTLRLNELDPRILPCLFLPEDGDALVLVRYEPGKGYFAFNGRKLETEYLLPEGIRGEAHVFRAVEAQPVDDGSSWMGRILERFRPAIWVTLVLTIVLNLFILVPPLFVMTVFNRIIPSGDLGLVPFLVLGLLIALGADWVLRGLRASLLAYIGARAEFLIGSAIFRRIMGLPAWATEQVTVGSQMSRIKDFESLREMFLGTIALVFYELPAALVFVIVLGIIEPWLLAVLALSIATYAMLALISQPKLTAVTGKASRAGTVRQEFLTDALAKMRAIRQAGAESRWFERFRLLSGKAVAAEFSSQQLNSSLATLSQAIGQLTALTALVACIVQVFAGSVGSGVVMAAMMIIWRLITPLQTAFVSLTTLYRAGASIRQIDNLMRLKAERDGSAPRQAMRRFQGELQFARVSFRYANDADPALLGVSLKVEPKRVVAIAGPNGAGKSTLLKLVTGLYSPQAGSVRIDNVDIRQMDPSDLRALVSYAPQRCDVFFGTIAQNLRLGHPTASDDELRWAAKMAGLYDDIMASPEGFNAKISDGQGEQLPNGFRQRLSLARAYLKPAPLMLFDEPGNGLDFEGDLIFQAALAELRKTSTILIVTHRPSHLRLADAVVYMEEGYVREVGTFDDLKTLIMGNL
ncbi:peptidase domain-containing ABC transporter [Magnetospirillum sp. UT-4]|uniref:peptidase domain-containing ABC transporter n=1 Tax=Magnetospirillum sp. UT-4 TaxID=2681467 RepID=UPI00137EF50B|nr:ATP-binding cassette domain-containing protein [Magnetospirillum sp. UT-4]CAA7612954.1 putative ATP-binding cassette subfamily C [Magnetospirillum sp. UT-4]